MVKAYSYIRFSSRAQANGGSLQRQIEASAAYCAEQGWQLDDSLRDLGRSAFRGDHAKFGALGKFIEMAKAGEIEKGSWLIVESFDRLGRDEIMAAAQRFLAILDTDISIVTLSDRKQWTKASMNGSFGDFVISIALMARAHDESLVKSQRSAHNWKRARERAGEVKMTARCPGWLSLAADRKAFNLIPERVAVVRRIYDETLAGIGRETIALRLNRDGVPAFRGQNGWHQFSVAKVLQNQAVIGVLQPHRKINGKPVPEGEPIKGYFPPIIDEATFWQVQARRKPPAGRKGRLMSNLFTGLARCASCGSNMVFIDKGRRARGRQYLMCGLAKRGLCANRTRHRYPELEAEMIEALRLFDFTKLLRPPSDDRAAALAAEIEAKTATADHMIATFSATTAAPVARRVEALYAEAQAAKVELEKLRAEQVRQPADFAELTRLLDSDLAADERYQLRSKIAAEMRRLIAEMVADGERITVRMHATVGTRVELHIARSQITHLQLWAKSLDDPAYPNTEMRPRWRVFRREFADPDLEFERRFEEFVGK